MIRRQSLDAQRKPVVALVIEYLAGVTISFVAILFLIWVAGGFR